MFIIYKGLFKSDETTECSNISVECGWIDQKVVCLDSLGSNLKTYTSIDMKLLLCFSCSSETENDSFNEAKRPTMTSLNFDGFSGSLFKEKINRVCVVTWFQVILLINRMWCHDFSSGEICAHQKKRKNNWIFARII